MTHICSKCGGHDNNHWYDCSIGHQNSINPVLIDVYELAQIKSRITELEAKLNEHESVIEELRRDKNRLDTLNETLATVSWEWDGPSWYGPGYEDGRWYVEQAGPLIEGSSRDLRKAIDDFTEALFEHNVEMEEEMEDD